MTLVFLDVETTGLDPARHEVWEIAYSVDGGEVLSSVVAWPDHRMDPIAVTMGNGFFGRGFGYVNEVSARFEADLIRALTGATIVGANPAFDAAFLKARWGEAPWHYRMLDIESYAMAVLCMDIVPSLAQIRADLVLAGHDIPAPDHTAAGDVACLIAVHKALRGIR